MRFRDLSVKRKLVVAAMLSATSALLLVSTALVVYDRMSQRQALAEDLSTLAEITGANCTAALTFRDRQAAEELLGSLRLKHGVRGAALLNPDGSLFARFGEVEAGADPALAPAADEDRADSVVTFTRDRIRLLAPIRLEGETVGTLLLESDLDELDERLWRYVGIVSVLLLACSAIAFVVASGFQRVIAAPIVHLAEIAHQVSQDKNYAVRAQGTARDEMGVLIRAFNDMLAEIERRDERLREQNAALERSNRELQDFAYVASHDLQEPLRKVQAFGDRLAAKAAGTLGPQGLDYIARMRNAAQRMQTLINDLLSFSRVTTRARPFVSVDLDRVAREVASDLEVRIEQTGAELRLRDLPAIEADPLQMRQLLQNLIGNALKFSRPEVLPLVEVTAELQPSSNGHQGERCILKVTDNGIGFDQKYLPRLFGIFQRLHSRASYEGNGVGLAICRKIAERHGGSITATSRPGEGTTFVVTLSAGRAEERSAS